MDKETIKSIESQLPGWKVVDPDAAEKEMQMVKLVYNSADGKKREKVVIVQGGEIVAFQG